MSLDEYTSDLDNTESGWQSAESTKEVSEKFKESVRKWAAGVKRTQKDEKKAKKYDFLLANFLVEILISKKYDFLLDDIFVALNQWYGANFILGLLSLVYPPISNKIREISGKQRQNFDFERKNEPTEFDDHLLDGNLKERINYWIEDIIDSVVIESSSIVAERILEQLLKQDETISAVANKVFVYFFHSLNVSISPGKAQNYTNFILFEVEKALKKLELEEV